MSAAEPMTHNKLGLEFSPDHWLLMDRHFETAHNRAKETLFSVGNGYLGLRGCFEEGLAGFTTEGTFINGFYDSLPLVYGEWFPGYATRDQVIVNVPNAKLIRLTFADGEVYDPLLPGSAIRHYRRMLDMRAGVMVREFTWESPSGKRLSIMSERLVSFRRPHAAAIRLTITPETDCGGMLTITSLINAEIRREASGKHDPRSASEVDQPEIEGQQWGDHGAFLFQRTANTQLVVACGLRDHLPGPHAVAGAVSEAEGLRIGHSYTVPLVMQQPVIFEKFIVYYTSLDLRPDALRDTVYDVLDETAAPGFDGLRAEQRAYLDPFWQAADVQIEGDDWLHGAIRFNLFHLLQSAGRGGQTSIAAKGLSGQGYNGHYFWDTEIYMLPFFLHTMPEVARDLLEYRFNTLNAARRRARELSHGKGALFPWRTINGVECSANPPTGTAQYHIDADIAFSAQRYADVTGDSEFMLNYGVELLCETARLWYDAGHFMRDGSFGICGVTGPDEYTTQVDNNTYTNLMARENLRAAADGVAWMQAHHPEPYARLQARINLEPGEVEAWQRAADHMREPRPVNLGTPDAPNLIMPQDDSFLARPIWDMAQVPPPVPGTDPRDPLLLQYHPLVYNRYQVCKQADLILAEFMLGHLPIFPREQKQRDVDYYSRITTHDSSLSRCIFSIMAAELADPARPDDPQLALAARFYGDSATIDLDDHRGETQRGIHAANMGGAWMGIVFGFAQMRARRDGLFFAPVLPPGWTAYGFQVFYQGRQIQVKVGPGRDAKGLPNVALSLTQGDPLDVSLYGAHVRVGE
jgi:alpha,alpha-trehalose phosphorylase